MNKCSCFRLFKTGKPLTASTVLVSTEIPKLRRSKISNFLLSYVDDTSLVDAPGRYVCPITSMLSG